MKRVFLITGPLIILAFVTGILYLIHTEAGLKWLTGKAMASVPGLSIQSAEGRLSGPMTIRGVNYRSGESSFGIDEITLEWKPSRLMLLEAHISELTAKGVSIIADSQKGEAKPLSSLPEISIPLKIILRKAVISNISIMKGSERKPLNIHTVSFRGDMDSEAIRINQLDLEMPELIIKARGKLSPHSDYPMSMKASWKVTLPGYEDISGRGEIEGTIKLLRIKQEITAPFYCNASMKISDILNNLSWDGKISILDFYTVKLNKEWPEMTFSGDVSGHGSDTRADISSLAVHLFDGMVTGRGSLRWGPDISWSFEMNSKRLNPGTQWPQWQGSVDMVVRSSGKYEENALTINPSEVFLKGRLRERLIKADARLSMADSELKLSGLEIRSGGSRLSLSGKSADLMSLKWKVNISDARDFIPKGKGEIEGSGTITGSRHYPVIKGYINGKAVSYDNYSAESLNTLFEIETKGERESLLNIHASSLMIGKQRVKDISFKGRGKVSAHSISMDATMDNKGVALLITGRYRDEAWSGRFKSALLDIGNFGKWSLREPASLYISTDKAGSESVCIVSNDTDLCFRASWERAEGAKGEFSLANLPLSTLKTLFPSPIEIKGSINGNGKISYTPEGMISGDVSLIMPSGKLHYQADDKAIDIPLGKSEVEILLNKRALEANAEIRFPDRGEIKGGISLPGFMPGITATENQQIIGQFSAELNNLDLVPVVTERLSNTSGAVAALVKINGTLSETAITGELTLQDGEAWIPDLGLRLREIDLTLKGDEGGAFTINGRLSSGSGHAAINGTVRLHKEKPPSALFRIQGENLEVIKIPGRWIVASPDIAFQVKDKTIDFSGSLKIPEAGLEPLDLSGAVLPSKDVIVTDMPVKNEKEEEWSVSGRLRLSLGDNVGFKGYGLTCRITGGIDLTEQPGTVTQGHGEFQILDGRYKAYGQDLIIEEGRLIFVGLINDPGLQIRAFRKIKDVTAGINIGGTIKAPKFHIYSEPPMDESDTLSYILFGRPMRQLSGSEGNTLYGTVLSAGLSAGGFIAKKIGAAFGMEDVEIEKGERPEQATLFIGKYLSPRLYITYGIGLFEPVSTVRLRYNLTRRLQVQTEYGIESGGDLLYIIER